MLDGYKLRKAFGFVGKYISKNFVQQQERRKERTPRFVNIGSAVWVHPLWHTLDKRSDWYNTAQGNTIDYEHDLMLSAPLPFVSNSHEAVFCSHVIEHMPDNEVQHLLHEVFKALSIGGYFRIVRPDIYLIYDAFKRKDSFFMNLFDVK